MGPELVLLGKLKSTGHCKYEDIIFLHGISINVNGKLPAKHDRVTHDNKKGSLFFLKKMKGLKKYRMKEKVKREKSLPNAERLLKTTIIEFKLNIFYYVRKTHSNPGWD